MDDLEWIFSLSKTCDNTRTGCMANVSAANSPTTKVEDKNFSHLMMIIVFGIFATTLPQPQLLGKLSITHLLKDNLGLPAQSVAGFFFLCGIAWYFKPLAGILTDAFPFMGTRRRNYMLFSAALSAVSWIGTFFLWKVFGSGANANHTLAFRALLIGSIVINTFMVMASTVTGAFLVEAGQSYGATGRFTSTRMFIQNICAIINGYAGGLLASVGFLWACGANALLVFSLFPITYIFLKEKKRRETNSVALKNAKTQLATIGKSKTLWWGLVFIFLFYFAPGLNTLQIFRQTNELGFSLKFVGLLGSYAGVAALASSAVYAVLVKKFSLRTMLLIGIGISGLIAFLYLPGFYTDSKRAVFVECANGLAYTLAEIALMDLAARATPVGCEGLGYSLILSFRNIALLGADFLGSYFHDTMHVPFNVMVMINGGTSLFVLILLPLLPATIMRSKDKAIPSEPDPELRAAEDDI